MKLSEKIFQRATIKGIADYLLFGSLPEPDGRDYEARLNAADEAYEKTVKQYDNNSASDLLSSANEMANEYACVYMELGLRTGFLLLTDLLKNLQGRPEIPSSNHTMNTADHSTEDDAEKNNTAENDEPESSVLQQFIRYRLDTAMEKTLRKDRTYQKVRQHADNEMKKLNNDIFSSEQLELIDYVLSKDNNQSSEYGRVAYQQGLMDTLNLLKELLLQK